MSKFKGPYQRAQGFAVLTLLFMALALMGVLATIIAISRTNAARPTDLARPFASSIILQGNNLAMAFQQMEAAGFTSSNITYGTPAGVSDMMNPNNIALSPQNPAVQAFASGASDKFWIYKIDGTTGPAVKIKGIGTDASGDYAFVVGDLDKTVCSEINRQLTGSTTIQNSGVPLSTWKGSTPAVSEGTAVDLSSVTAVAGMMQGCVATTETGGVPDKYVYFTVVEAQ